jgi:DNA-binding Lrp family transcriptional regulator
LFPATRSPSIDPASDGARTARAGMMGPLPPIPEETTDVITAVVMITTDSDRIPEAARTIADLEGVSEVYSVTGEVDLIAIVRVRRHEELADVIADRLSKSPGVLSTQTYIAFQTYSRHDLEEAFSLGLDD